MRRLLCVVPILCTGWVVAVLRIQSQRLDHGAGEGMKSSDAGPQGQVPTAAPLLESPSPKEAPAPRPPTAALVEAPHPAPSLGSGGRDAGQKPKQAPAPKPAPAPVPAPATGVQCPTRAKRKKKWAEVVGDDMKLMKLGDAAVAKSCQRQGDALVFTLDVSKAVLLGGNAYEMQFPDYIVADEPGEGWRDKRSTLQLFATGSAGGELLPLGPAHAPFDEIERAGNGAFRHWREPMTDGPDFKSHLRFSTPRNEPLKRLKDLKAVVHPMAPPMGWAEFVYKFNRKAKDFDAGKRRRRQQIFRELYLHSFPTVGVEPHLVDKPEQTVSGTWYLWRVSHHDEFDVKLEPGEIYQKRMPYVFAQFFGEYERQGAKLFPPPQNYVYYENKVGLAKLFKQSGVRTPETWVFSSKEEALRAAEEIRFPVVVKDPYGYSSIRLLQAASREEYAKVIDEFFAAAKSGVEALVQSKVVALREARITYVDGRPFHGYWRIRPSLDSASAASTRGGYQDFSFPLADIAPQVARFANATGIPVGGVDFIWQEAKPDVRSEPYTLEVSPTSDVNPPTPPDWKQGYAEFKKTPSFRASYLRVRRQWTDSMALAVVDRYRRSKRHLFVDIDNVVSLSAERVKRNRGGKAAYTSKEVLKDQPVPDAAAALRELRPRYFVRFLTARGQYEDAFNTTQRWLALHGFSYDELIVVRRAEDKLAHLTQESLLVDDFTVGHEKEVPERNDALTAKLRASGVPFVVFPFGGLWADVMPQLLRGGAP